jgi:hypothetical protein
MKKLSKIILSLVFIVAFIFLFTGKLYSQPANIYTPRGSLVTNTYNYAELSQADLDIARNYVITNFPLATQFKPLKPASIIAMLTLGMYRKEGIKYG